MFWIYSTYLTIWFCYVVFNSHMFNATEVQLCKWCFHIKFLLFMRPMHVRALSKCLHNNNGSESTIVKTVELTCVEYTIPRSRTNFDSNMLTAFI
jgi:hypothetical protein